MNRVKKFLSISLLIFISCGFHTEPGPLHPIPILKVKMGEVKTIDLSKYLKEEKVDLLFNEPLDHISLNGYELTVDASINFTIETYGVALPFSLSIFKK